MSTARLHWLARSAAGLLIVAATWGVGQFAATQLRLPVPGPVAGLALLFLGFMRFPALAKVTAPACDQLLRYFPLFLYPFGAGFLSLGGTGITVLLKILIAVLVSLVASMTVCAAVFRLFKRHHA